MLDEKNCRFITANKTIELTRMETYLLSILIENRGKVVLHEILEKNFYGMEGIKGGISSRIGSLRRKLKGLVEIKTRIGVGYYI